MTRAATTATTADPTLDGPPTSAPPGPGDAHGGAGGSHRGNGEHGGREHGDGGADRTAPKVSRLPAIVRRRLQPFDARLDPYSWIATGVVTLIAGVLRLVGLDFPKGMIFDEVYYATDARDLFQKGVEWDENANGPAYVVHPPLGKWIIGLGEQVFGYNAVGWRISAAVVGTLSVLLIVRIARRMFHSTALGCAAGLLMALDGMHLVMSRTALLDIFLLFFVVAAFGALLLDRDARRRRWLRAMEAGLDPGRGGSAGRLPVSWRTSVPWWRLLAAVLCGCALGVKWSAVFYVLLFALLSLVWEYGARRSAGVRRPLLGTVAYETGWLLAFGVLVAGTYLLSWSGWLLTDTGYYRHFREQSGLSEAPIIGALQNLAEYHLAAYRFHVDLGSHHVYQSWPWQWLLLGRPVAFHWSSEGSCGAASCASEILLLGTPVLWWSFLPALAALAWFGIARRDWRAAAIGLGVAAGLLPWFWYALDGRTMFYFYALPAEPFLVLAVVYVLGAIMTSPPNTPPGDAADRRLIGAVVAGAYVLLVALCFAYFYPIYVGTWIPYENWSGRMWLGGRWI